MGKVSAESNQEISPLTSPPLRTAPGGKGGEWQWRGMQAETVRAQKGGLGRRKAVPGLKELATQ